MNSNNQKRYQEAKKRIMTPQEKARRDEWLKNRDALKEEKVKPKKSGIKKRAQNNRKKQSNHLHRNKQNNVNRNKINNGAPSNRERNPRKPGKTILEHLVIFLALIIIFLLINLTFWVQEIEVRSNEFSTREQAIGYVTQDIAAKNSLYIWGKNKMVKNEYPVPIENINVKFKWPWSIILEIEDKQIVGATTIDETYVYFDKAGWVLEVSEIKKENIMFLDGLNVKKVTLYEKLPVKEEDIFDQILNLRNVLEEDAIKPTQIMANDYGGIEIALKDIVVNLGSENYEERILHMNSILLELEGQSGTLDLSNYSESNKTITFK